MVFNSAAKITADIVEEIANSLIDTRLWHNVDTAWTTIDKTANNSRRVLAYGVTDIPGKGSTTLSTDVVVNSTILPVVNETDFAVNDKIIIGTGYNTEVRIITSVATGSLTIDAGINIARLSGEPIKYFAFEIYLAMDVINQTSGMNYYQITSYPYPWFYGKGIRFFFSSAWNGATHVYSGSTQSAFMPFETCYNCGVPTDMATLQVTYYLWTEDNGNGFVIMGKSATPTGASYQQSFLAVVERTKNDMNGVPIKEYLDGYSNFYLYKVCNIYPGLYDGDATTTIWRDRVVLRPFAYQYPDGGGRYTANANGGGVSFCPLPGYFGYKSAGNGKVYYVKPIVNNEPSQLSPIFQSDLFFQWSEGVGLIDGDVVAVQGQALKYLCKALDSPDSASRLTYAIKYLG